jgi:predicted NUDIX family NTP pyrophosphohydrolase
MPRRSAGLLLHRRGPHGLEVLLVHPGGPFWASKDEGAWTVPKGEYAEGEDQAATAEREFAEELGTAAPPGPRLDLGELRQAGGKWTRLWAVAGDLDVSLSRSNTFDMEWPPRSGRQATFPEVDRAGWFTLAEARVKLLPSLVPFLDRLAERAEGGPRGGAGVVTDQPG